MASKTPACKTHPKYKGIKAPSVPCEPCWAYWFGMSEQCINCGCDLKYAEVNKTLS